MNPGRIRIFLRELDFDFCFAFCAEVGGGADETRDNCGKFELEAVEAWFVSGNDEATRGPGDDDFSAGVDDAAGTVSRH